MPPSINENNPFAGYRNAVPPHRFVGRNQEIDNIRQRVLSEGERGSSVAILGEAHVGKTSLMKYVFFSEPHLHDRKVVIVDVSNIGRFDEPIKFFRHIIKRANEELLSYPEYDSTLNSPSLTSIDFIEVGMFEFLQRVKGMGYRLVFLLDGFHNIQIPFGKSPEAYHIMHTMIEGYQSKVSCVATVRGDIEEIQKSATKGFSTLIGKFQSVNLGLMSDAEVRLLINHRLSQTALRMAEEEIQILIREVGLHPFFIDMVGFNWFTKKIEGSYNAIREAIDLTKSEMFTDFDNFRVHLGTTRFARLVELANGKQYEPSQDGELVKLGHLTEKHDAWGNKIVQPFSELYAEYLGKFKIDDSQPKKPEKLPRNIKKKILFLALEPVDQSPLRTGEELAKIKKELRLGRNGSEYEVAWQTAVQLEDISRSFLEEKPTIVHISGHGDINGNLLFGNLSGSSQAITPEVLSSFLKLSSESIECVLLNTCDSEQQASVIANHIQFVIGMPGKISDPTSIAFSVGFYQALSAAYSYETAYKAGCVQHGANRVSTEMKPMLFVEGKLIESL